MFRSTLIPAVEGAFHGNIPGEHVMEVCEGSDDAHDGEDEAAHVSHDLEEKGALVLLVVDDAFLHEDYLMISISCRISSCPAFKQLELAQLGLTSQPALKKVVMESKLIV